ncbi:MAG: hypothetical protein COA69_02585 [Robiginitomaculum sp.]|nr:MAG: hypothetical protein COA69_02585 [Robiginitomaculum sp.]
MFKQAYSLFLSPRGRIGRGVFIKAVLVWGVFYAAQYFWFEKTGTSNLNFYLSLALLILNIQVVFCIFGKRLHDFGRSTWALIGLFALLLIIAIFVMLNFGGLEYFNTIMENPGLQSDPQAMKDVHQIYQDTLGENIPKSRILMSILPVGFILWLAVTPGQACDNRYGEPLNTGTKIM